MTDHDAMNPNDPVEPTRQYLISEGQIRGAFLLSAVGMAAVLIGLLLLATSRPQGTFEPLDGTEFQGAVAAATDQLEGYELLEDGRARIDIDRAMELVVERGVADPGFARAGAAAPGAQAEGGADEAAAGGEGEAAAGEPATEPAAVDGAEAYAVCASCHQPNGQGIPGAFPPLAGHAPELYAADPGYPITVLLYGLMGQIEVDGATYNGLMPSHAHLGDAELAAILNHVMTAFGNQELLPETWEPYLAQDFAELRDQGLSFDDVYALRQELGLP
ncbi:MAG TPA: cytochrome c [Trueperaceae bacterium]|nr:cytochrome c [Trueperaceae bacterium]